MISVANSLFKYWIKRKIKLSLPISIQLIEQFETQNSISFPDEFKNNLLIANGFVDRDSDASMISFWPLERFEAVTIDKQSPETYFIFADFLIDSHHYGIKLKPFTAKDIGSIWAIANRRLIKVAHTFEEFVELYLTPYEKDFGNKILELKW